MKQMQTEAPRAKSPVEEELEAAMAERDALMELKHEREERQGAEAAASLARNRADAAASLARTRSAENRSQLAAAKAELARLDLSVAVKDARVRGRREQETLLIPDEIARLETGEKVATDALQVLARSELLRGTVADVAAAVKSASKSWEQIETAVAEAISSRSAGTVGFNSFGGDFMRARESSPG